jgi:hypothetical protein
MTDSPKKDEKQNAFFQTIVQALFERLTTKFGSAWLQNELGFGAN